MDLEAIRLSQPAQSCEPELPLSACFYSLVMLVRHAGFLRGGLLRVAEGLTELAEPG